MPEQFSLSHVESIHRVFHGEAALTYFSEQLKQFSDEYILFQPHSYAECFKLAATYAVGLYRNKPYGLQTADTAIVTALVILRIYGITIEAGANHQFYEHLITSLTIDSYAATLRGCSERVPPDFAFSSEC